MRKKTCILAFISLVVALVFLRPGCGLIDTIQRAAPWGWQVVSIEPCDAPEGWRGICGNEKGRLIKLSQPGVRIKDSWVGEYVPAVRVYLMPSDWEGSTSQLEILSVRRGKLIRYPRIPTYSEQEYPARFLGETGGIHVFSSIIGHGDWHNAPGNLAVVLGTKLEVETRDPPLCGSSISLADAVRGADVIIAARTLSCTADLTDGCELWKCAGRFEITSILKGTTDGEGIQVIYECFEANVKLGRIMSERWVREDEEVLLFLKPETSSSLKATKMLYAGSKTEAELRKLLARNKKK